MHINVIGKKLYRAENFVEDYVSPKDRVLNIGSSSSGRPEWINIDITRQENISVQGDMNRLPFKEGSFDIVIIGASLQYAKSPSRVARETYRVLRLGGLVFIDAPFVQQLCQSQDDLWRFSPHGLRLLFRKFKIERVGAAMCGSSALAFLGTALFKDPWLNILASIVMYPIGRYTQWGTHEDCAGAIYLIGRKD